MHSSADVWRRGPFSPDAETEATVHTRRTVLAVVHHVTAATRLGDVLPLLERDPRIAVAYTRPPASAFTGGLDELLHAMGALVLPWQQAVHTRFDLAVAASHGMLEHLHAPVLTVPHGTGPGKFLHRGAGAGRDAARPVTSLIAERIVVNGRVVPSALAVGHDRHLRRLEDACPDAVPVAFVGGDPCLDRLLAGRPHRAAYRTALGAGPDHRVVFVSSTWGRGSLFGQCPDVLTRAAEELPSDRYRIVAALHPHIWAWYGRRQVLAWCADALRHGVLLLPPEEGWRAALVAADRILGDHGSVTCYGLAAGVPAALGAFPEDDIAPGTHIARLGTLAPRIDWSRPLGPQLDDAARAYRDDTYAAVRRDLSSRPGEAAALLRREMYRLLRLPEPDRAAVVEPVPPPRPIGHEERWAI
ncbi:hypothetical protein [Actinomadura flavalba]|uniref:hypothetical protein n=1 Tax=Actinomadura flavalba TaxID=1120938 RepID=UPI00037AE74E|nr:hypothetical protein [Actinomadura flavalba]